MKYIIFEGRAEGRNTEVLPVIFPDVMKHKDVAEHMNSIKIQPEGPFSNWWMWPEPVSAGFFYISAEGRVVCNGDSESLRLASRPGDSEIVAAALSSGLYDGAKPRTKEVA